MAPSKNASDPITIVLADDHTVMRRGLRMLLQAEPGFDVVAEAGHIMAVLQEVRGHRPDVLVLDLNMPGGSSVEAIKQLKAFASSTAVVVLTMESGSSFVREAHAAGAVAYVMKDAAETQLVTAIRNAAGRPTPDP